MSSRSRVVEIDQVVLAPDEEQTHATTCRSNKVGDRRGLLTFNLNRMRRGLPRYWSRRVTMMTGCSLHLSDFHFATEFRSKNYLYIVTALLWFCPGKSAREINNLSFPPLERTCIWNNAILQWSRLINIIYIYICLYNMWKRYNNAF